MLFVPWRDEEAELDDVDIESLAKTKMPYIIENSKHY